METLPTGHQVDEDLKVAKAALDAAALYRRRTRRRTSKRSPDRQENIEKQVMALARHGSILRSHLKRSDHHPGRPYTLAHRRAIKRLLRALRIERWSLKRMLPR